MSDYSAAIGRKGWTVLHEAVFGYHQGDYAMTLRKGDVFAFTVVGYGSCSGCDWYEADVPWQEGPEREAAIEVIAAELERTLDVTGSVTQIAAFIENDGRKALDWYRNESTFDDEIIALMRSLPTEEDDKK